jgi:RNA polymerase sigma factor for flagellar operon FliA
MRVAELSEQACVAQYAPLVKRIAHHMMAKLPPSVELDDMIQAGMMGLLDAVNRYEESQGAQFETYAVQRIRGAMLDELRASDWLPRGHRKNLRRIEAAMHKIEQRHCRPATEQELAQELGVSLAEYQEMLQEARGYQLVYYEDFNDEDSEHFLDRHCADPRANPLDALEDESLRTAVVEAIDHLPAREKMVMGMYYEQEMNLREIAAVLGVSESRVCQLHSQAVARLRTKLRHG